MSIRKFCDVCELPAVYLAYCPMPGRMIIPLQTKNVTDGRHNPFFSVKIEIKGSISGIGSVPVDLCKDHLLEIVSGAMR